MIKRIKNSMEKFEIEAEFYSKGYKTIIGIDEVGRGPLAGPVVASACVLREMKKLKDVEINFENNLWNYVKDSKKLTHKKREEMFKFVGDNFFVGIGIVSPEVIDKVNILQATFLAMKKAVNELYKKNKLSENCMLLVDGNATIPNISKEQTCIIGGDNISKSIAAASIIAKVTRDRIMVDYGEMFPQYGFDAHKGYGTKAHMEALKNFGITPIHRKSFKPIKKVM